MVPELQKLLLAIKKRGGGSPPGEQSNRGAVKLKHPLSKWKFFKKTKDFVATIVSTCYVNLAFSRN
jgi:hypothetical protein